MKNYSGTPGPAPDRVRADSMILRLAAGQHGVVEYRQLIEAGISPAQIQHRVAAGRLERLHRSVYRAGSVAAMYEREMAAVLACGRGAVLSHCSAAAVWQLLRQIDGAAAVEVSIVRGYRVRGAGVRVYRFATLQPDEVTRHVGLPITTPARTLLDVARTLDAWQLEQILARAVRDGLVSVDALALLLKRHPRQRGTRALRRLLAASVGPAFTRSEAEARFLALIRKAGLADPVCNVVVKGFEVDFLWRAERLIVEIDGFAYHSSRDAFERDRRRDALLTAAGLRVLRFTWRQLVDQPEVLVARVAQALGGTYGA